MKKTMLLFFFLLTLFSSNSQRTIKITTPCNDDILFKTPGKWFTDYGGLLDNGSEYIPFNKAQVKEATKRMDVVREIMMKIYPEPMGIDVGWHHSIGRGSFGEQVRYIKNSQDIWNREAIVEKPVASFSFICGFFRHGCNRSNSYEIRRGYPGETGTWLGVHANGLGAVAKEVTGGDDHMLINGYPVHLRQPVKQEFDGYEIFYSKANVFPNYRTGELLVLIHRKGELPYIPVTRKQYLDQCLVYLPKWYDESLKGFDIEPIQSKADEEIRKEQIKKFKKMRDDVLKHYSDEREETAKKGLLESPAFLPLDIYNQTVDMPIFVEENTGWMLVIENPKYMRKDLPKYVPQFFTMAWSWDEFWKPQADIAKLMEEKFPFDKLQAMIDK